MGVWVDFSGSVVVRKRFRGRGLGGVEGWFCRRIRRRNRVGIRGYRMRVGV